jgi:hypothetical protein
MIRALLFFFSAMAMPCLGANDYLGHTADPNPLGDTDVVLLEPTSGAALYKFQLSTLKTYVLDDLATVATTGAYSDLSGKPTLGSLAALSPTGTGSNANFLRGDDAWANPIIVAGASGTNVYTATPSPALTG